MIIIVNGTADLMMATKVIVIVLFFYFILSAKYSKVLQKVRSSIWLIVRHELSIL